eukprot:6789575-Prymnesium_polylepis.1
MSLQAYTARPSHSPSAWSSGIVPATSSAFSCTLVKAALAVSGFVASFANAIGNRAGSGRLAPSRKGGDTTSCAASSTPAWSQSSGSTVMAYSSSLRL